MKNDSVEVQENEWEDPSDLEAAAKMMDDLSAGMAPHQQVEHLARVHYGVEVSDSELNKVLGKYATSEKDLRLCLVDVLNERLQADPKMVEISEAAKELGVDVNLAIDHVVGVFPSDEDFAFFVSYLDEEERDLEIEEILKEDTYSDIATKLLAQKFLKVGRVYFASTVKKHLTNNVQ